MEFIHLNLERVFYVVYQYLFEDASLTVPRQAVIFWDIVTIVSTLVTLLLLTGSLYVWLRLAQVRKDEHAAYYADLAEAAAGEIVEEKRNERWEQVLRHVNSDNPNDWRQAIIEADTILEDIVARAGYPGDSLGERLRGAEKSDFHSIDEAWDAHKVRNRIAHDGSNFMLNKREALRVIDLYREVFEEFYFI